MSLAILESLKYGISDTTIKNWEKLNTISTNRLTTRANKRRSVKRVLPVEYISNKRNIPLIKNILEYIDRNNFDIMSSIFSLGISLLKREGIYENRNVVAVLSEYSNIPIISDLSTLKLPEDEFDILGLIYQSYLCEGEKNVRGSYYTPPKIVYNMTKDFSFFNNESFFDPCCGSGSFLLCVKAKNPNLLFGVDSDEIAVIISKINLLIKYKNICFIPQIYCFDYLMGNSFLQCHPVFEHDFDYIATNPPWGAMNDSIPCSYSVVSKETFSYFFVKSFEQLKKNGIIRFLFPEAVLNVKIHKDIRKYIIETAGLVRITMYDDMFSGVTTKYTDIQCRKGSKESTFIFESKGKKRYIETKNIYETENMVFNFLSEDDFSIIQIAKKRGRFSLQNSTWALGIVTGDNKGKLFSEQHMGMEKIYTGKEIQPYILCPAKNYILFDRRKLQQVAKDEIYRAPEKLVYKFISKKITFAYDNSGSLFLNSANILIPDIPSMSVKSVMAFLNSSLFQFLYIKLFGEVKILKGNLIGLPFPELSKEENENLSLLVDSLLAGDSSKKGDIEKFIFDFYGISEKQIEHIRRTVDGKTN